MTICPFKKNLASDIQIQLLHFVPESTQLLHPKKHLRLPVLSPSGSLLLATLRKVSGKTSQNYPLTTNILKFVTAF
jgi:hypothetical protein